LENAFLEKRNISLVILRWAPFRGLSDGNLVESSGINLKAGGPVFMSPPSVTASKDDTPAADQAATANVAGLGSNSVGGGLIQTTSD